MEVKNELKKIATKIDKEVAKVLDEEFKSSKSISPIIKNLIKTMKPIPAEGGKRLRGAFVYNSYRMLGGDQLNEIYKIAAAIELTHAYLLVHDDVMDDAPLRRGFKTIHEVYKDNYNNVYGLKNGVLFNASKHFGNSIAINIGDIFSHISGSVFVDSKFPNDLKIKALSRFHRRITDTGYGQVIDVFGEFEDVNEAYVMKVHLYKTGYYTYENPLHMGAILAGATKRDLEVLTEYAIPGGIAFQIIDDIIDAYSNDQSKTGKVPGTDIKEGKKTLLVVKAFEKANSRDKAILDSALGNKYLSDSTLDTVRKIFVDTGSLEYSKKKAEKLLTKSTDVIKNYRKWNNEGKEFLIAINDYMLTRKV
ncbi:MAG: polyprenyl synthetase family protein [Candidatus Dojkabacteria bacterium]|nr:polyprenyl synthetase family protein [Candidatus Dojkabacteria bacterium]MDQ7021526.1 polyprenyl synthetase family protein [Candidatus Dojkabacteria bacterium]